MDKRLRYRVILKALTFAGVLVLVIVFFKSLFVSTSTVNTNDSQNSIETQIVELSDIAKGQIHKVRWKSKEVIILNRKTVSNDLTDGKKSYSIFFNTGDSGNCPLFHDSSGFKDVCSGKKFDTLGREKGYTANGTILKSPPFYFTENKVIIGLDKASQEQK